jgi:anti-sigma-K factor RskA
MDHETIHELTAAYALDALDADDRTSFEEHLANCQRCREEVAELAGVAGALAYGVAPADPPPALRERILEAARAERPNVVALRPRWASPVAAAAAVAACAAIGLGVWNISLHDDLAGDRSGVLRSVPLIGGSGSVVVDRDGAGALVLSKLSSAPAGSTYEAWVIQGRSASPAGLFQGGGTTTLVELTRPVPAGALVAVTLEPAGGTSTPTRKPFIESSPV